jgi:hypothetical protein
VSPPTSCLGAATNPNHRPQPLHTAAFDQGLIAFDNDPRLLFSKLIMGFLPYAPVKASFETHEEKPLDLPGKPAHLAVFCLAASGAAASLSPALACNAG